jgi:hypothetical protein
MIDRDASPVGERAGASSARGALAGVSAMLSRFFGDLCLGRRDMRFAVKVASAGRPAKSQMSRHQAAVANLRKSPARGTGLSQGK